MCKNDTEKKKGVSLRHSLPHTAQRVAEWAQTQDLGRQEEEKDKVALSGAGKEGTWTEIPQLCLPVPFLASLLLTDVSTLQD
jgi:hypothetical protein